uniref:Uncharacterized protein n=1 Tax=Arcella intermedia TaxID=1963864 RepID=A0A6B2KYL4_9EUKA
MFSSVIDLDNIGAAIQTTTSNIHSTHQTLNELSNELPAKIENATIITQNALKELEILKHQFKDIFQDILQKETTSQSLISELSKYHNKILYSENKKQYQDTLEIISKLSSTIQTTLKALDQNSGDLSERDSQVVFDSYTNLLEIWKMVSPFDCVHLKELLIDRIENLGIEIKYYLLRSYRNQLNALHWPTPLKDVVGTDSSKKVLLKQHEKAFRNLHKFQYLLIHTISESPQTDNSSTGTPQSPSHDFESKLFFKKELFGLKELLDPIRLRFKFHFRQNQKTNNPENPEYFFSFIIGLLRNNLFFLKLSEELARLEGLELVLLEQFVIGLMEMISEKLMADWKVILDSEVIFWKTLNEALLFKNSIMEILGCSEEFASPLDLFTSQDVFPKWIQMEVEHSQKYLRELEENGDGSVWKCDKNTPKTEVDPLKPTITAIQILNICNLIRERYKVLLREHKYRFLNEVQIPLLSEYGDSIERVQAEIAKKGSRDDIIDEYCNFINSTNYCSTVLKSWGQDPFYIELQDTPESDSVFQTYESFYHKFSTALLEQLTQIVFTIFKTSVTNYLKYWSPSTTRAEKYAESVSVSFCNTLVILRDHMSLIHEFLNAKSFSLFCKLLGKQLSRFVMDVILRLDSEDGSESVSESEEEEDLEGWNDDKTMDRLIFTENDILQFTYDMNALSNLFHSYDTLSPNPASFMKEIKEIIVLFTMKEDSFLFLKSKVKSSLKSPSKSPELSYLLHKLTLTKLTLPELHKLLHIRLINKTNL